MEKYSTGQLAGEAKSVLKHGVQVVSLSPGSLAISLSLSRALPASPPSLMANRRTMQMAGYG